jgi:class 3 adenylate cyclase
LARVVTTHHGREVKGARDGILAAFESASDGVAAAVAMQRPIYEDGAGLCSKASRRVLKVGYDSLEVMDEFVVGQLLAPSRDRIV